MVEQLHVDQNLTSSMGAVYALGRDPDETDRLKQQASELRAQALVLLDRLHLERGGTAIDLGCGPLGILDLLAERVGPGGRVVGMDSDPAHVALARDLARNSGLENVEVLEGDARDTGLPSAFDLVHARTLLVNLPDPQDVVDEMARLARPGGHVAIQDPDITFLTCPGHPAAERLKELFFAAFELQGADLSIGRRLPHLLRGAGLVEVGVDVRADVYPLGHSRRTLVPDLVRSLRPKIVQRGLAGERELEALDYEVREHLADPATLVLPHLFFLAWGRKPSEAVTAA